MSHDPFFIRDFEARITDLKPTPIPIVILTINSVQNGYSAFGVCDIEGVCESPYYRHHRIVRDYLDGKSAANPRDVAKAIRPMLEGYLHRRFPGRIPRRALFGNIIHAAQHAQPPDPLANLTPSLIEELAKINEYVGPFHHDPKEGAEAAAPNETELRSFARRALNVIYVNG
jgi:hypothetical protein